MMEAGREMDALVAIHIFHWRNVGKDRHPLGLPRFGTEDDAIDVWGSHDTVRGSTIRELVPAYSTSIEAAWTVVEHMGNLTLTWSDADRELWRCEFEHPPQSAHFGNGMAPTAPLAIVRACIAAVGVDV